MRTCIQDRAISRLDNDEIGIIFGNLFDNAIEAAKAADERWINLDISIKGEYMSIVITNSVADAVLRSNALLETTKDNKSLHGYGIKNIRRIVQKNSGMINFFEEDGYFGCHILI